MLKMQDLNTIIEKISLFSKIILVTGIALCCQFLICGIIGVARGHSIQSHISNIILLAGLFILLPFIKRYSTLPYFFSFMIIYFSVIGILQGKHKFSGDELYDQENYQVSIYEYKKEIETWYLRLRYNPHEASSRFRIAECYAQLEDFDKAREIYKKVSEIYDGYYQGRAKQELLELDEALLEIASYSNKLESETDDNQKADQLFDLAILYRRIGCNKKALEQYSAIQNLNIRDSRKEQAKKFARNKW